MFLFGGPGLLFVAPDWICGSPHIDSGAACVPGSSSFHIYYIAGGVAYFSTLAPWMTKRWRQFAWITIAVLAIVRMIQGLTPPVDEFLVIGLAYAVGADVLLAVGMPNRRPRGAAIVVALHRSGLDLSELARADVDARGSTPYFAKLKDGDRLFVKVLTPEERAADALFRMVRIFRLKGVGDERPFSNLKRSVEHEAVGSLKAASDGVVSVVFDDLRGCLFESVWCDIDSVVDRSEVWVHCYEELCEFSWRGVARPYWGVEDADCLCVVVCGEELFEVIDEDHVGVQDEGFKSTDDVDIVIELADRAAYESAVAAAGYEFLYADPANDAADGTRLNWVVRDADGKELDVHVVDTSSTRRVEDGTEVYSAMAYPVGSLDGWGTIAGEPVPCVAAEHLVAFHTGYELRDKDFHDVLALCEAFDIEPPIEYRNSV